MPVLNADGRGLTRTNAGRIIYPCAQIDAWSRMLFSALVLRQTQIRRSNCHRLCACLSTNAENNPPQALVLSGHPRPGIDLCPCIPALKLAFEFTWRKIHSATSESGLNWCFPCRFPWPAFDLRGKFTYCNPGFAVPRFPLFSLVSHTYPWLPYCVSRGLTGLGPVNK
jgi:hypothetical protein